MGLGPPVPEQTILYRSLLPRILQYLSRRRARSKGERLEEVPAVPKQKYHLLPLPTTHPKVSIKAAESKR